MSTRTPGHVGDDRLLDLLHELLTPETAEATLAHLRECAECEERFRVLAAERETLRTRPRPRLVDGRVQLAGAARGRRGLLFGVLGTAAAALLALVLLPQLSRQATAPARYFLPVDEHETRARSRQLAEDGADVLAAIEAYRRHDVQRALAELLRARVPEGYRDLHSLYLASCLELSGQPVEALGLLEALNVATLPQPWRRRAEWIEYRAWHARGDEARAAELLERLAAAPDEIGELARSERARRNR
ncbi:MAG TPA: hypothetical protein VJS92_13475 [Candidatus Polarisedimenticolaceae bacterium]|nr:hypothetical protein [Candidatus Polarisedimenticolaceae bacterium]